MNGHAANTRSMYIGLSDVHLAGFAPAFTLSFHDSESSRKPPVPIASVVMGNPKNEKLIDLRS